MTAAVLACSAVAAALLAVRELIGAIEGPRGTAPDRGRVARALGIRERIAAAGLETRISTAAVMAAHPFGAMLGAIAAQIASPAAPARLWIVVMVALPVAGFLTPRVLLDLAARRRLDRADAALPAALEIVAAGTSAGRPPGRIASNLGAQGHGPLERELAVFAASLDAGASNSSALTMLAERLPTPAVRAFTRALDRSRQLGTPVADQLREQAVGLRAGRARARADRAARAAPKIQLVVALILVPSVLLIVAAALAANADLLLGDL